MQHFTLLKAFPNGGRVELMDGFVKKSDYEDLLLIANFFAQQGHLVLIPTEVHYKDAKYSFYINNNRKPKFPIAVTYSNGTNPSCGCLSVERPRYLLCFQSVSQLATTLSFRYLLQRYDKFLQLQKKYFQKYFFGSFFYQKTMLFGIIFVTFAA